MVSWKSKGVLGAVFLCGVVWFAHPAQDRVNELEEQISVQYKYANPLLRDTVKALLEYDFNEPLTVENEEDFNRLTKQFWNVIHLFFNGGTVHTEWRDRVEDTKIYFMNYANGSPLSEEEAADFYQVLKATRLISRDLRDYTENSEFYDAMHSEDHEMVEQVKKRLDWKYKIEE
ncbi:hypothetical protein MKX73_08780 [Solibacillus sp. FSL W7-1436]|uniref:hypothetical protein n=1 Tax=Solibacillus sp. FSL W7-1436 TaxID=2921705 RepID=UPI0030F9BCD1